MKRIIMALCMVACVAVVAVPSIAIGDGAKKAKKKGKAPGKKKVDVAVEINYDPQPYTPVKNSPAQLAKKQAALEALRKEVERSEFTEDGGYDDADIKKSIKGVGKNLAAVESHFKADGSWHTDLPKGSPLTRGDYALHKKYLTEVLALAYQDKYQGKQYKKTIYDTLAWYFDNSYAAPHTYKETYSYGDGQVNTGLLLIKIGLVMYDEIHADRAGDRNVERLFQQMREYGHVFISAAPQIRGANWGLRMDECLSYILFTNDPRDMDEYAYHWKKSLSFVRWDPERIGRGVHSDWSMTHHGDMNYWGMYGWAILNNAILFGELFEDKPWAYTQKELDFIANCLLEGLRWSYYRGVMEYTAAPKHSVIKIGDKDCTAQLQESVARLISVGRDRLGRKPELMEYEASLRSPFWSEDGIKLSDEPDFLSGHRYYWSTEYQTHRRSNFAFYVNRCSQRARPPESREGGSNLHYGTGFTPILRRGDEFFLSRLCWDYQHLPGTTAEQGQTIGAGFAGSTIRGLNLFSGGVTDGEYGFGAFELNLVRYETDNSGSYKHINGAGGLKGTFFFDDGMVALGQRINRMATVDGQNEILTTINNVRRLTDVVYSVDGSAARTVSPGKPMEQRFAVTDVAWFHHDGMGYVIWPSVNDSTKLVVSFGDRPFNAEIKESYKKKMVAELGRDAWDAGTMDMFRLWIDHGKNPTDDTYVYAVLPDCTLAELKAYVAKPPVQVTANARGVQAVENIKDGLCYASFAKAGTANFGGGKTMMAECPLMVMARQNAKGDCTFHASNPEYVGLRNPFVPGTGKTIGTLYEKPVAIQTRGFGCAAQVEFNLPVDRGREGASVRGKVK